MRFRSRFDLSPGCMCLICALLFGYGWIFAAGAHKNQDGVVALLGVFAAIVCLSLPLFTYWDFESNGLRAHGLWSTVAVSWEDVMYVGPLKSSLPKIIVIEYERKAPLAGRGRIGFTPAKREAFLAALRQFAPQAEFEV